MGNKDIALLVVDPDPPEWTDGFAGAARRAPLTIHEDRSGACVPLQCIDRTRLDTRRFHALATDMGHQLTKMDGFGNADSATREARSSFMRERADQDTRLAQDARFGIEYQVPHRSLPFSTVRPPVHVSRSQLQGEDSLQ